MLKRFLNKYLNDKSGNMAMIVSISGMLLMVAVGAAIDTNGMHKQKNWQQDLTDAVVIAAVRSSETTEEAMQIIADDVADEINQTDLSVQIDLVKGTDFVQVTSTAQYPSMMMGVFGNEFVTVKSLSEVPLGGAGGGPVNIALVLDNTRSMRGSKINALRTHAVTMVNTLQANNPDTEISVIPFNQYVNVGEIRRNEVWMNVPDDSSEGGEPVETEVCRTTRERSNPHNCRTATRSYPTGDGAFITRSSRTCDYDYGPPIETCSMQTHYTGSSSYWTGCVGSRPGDLADESGYVDSQGVGHPYPGVMETDGNGDYFVMGCGVNEIMPMTNSFPSVREKIESLSTFGDTHIPAGLMWGWNSLRSDLPIGVPSNADEGRTRALVLMSDGTTTAFRLENELNGAYVYSGGGPYPMEQDYTEDLCESIKDDGIQIFTIAFRLPGGSSGTHDMMEACASSEAHYYDAGSNNELEQAFLDIANSFGGEVRLSR